MLTSTLRLEDIARALDIDVEAFCERCGAPLGRYSAGLRFPNRDLVVLHEPGYVERTDDIGWIRQRIDDGTIAPEARAGYRGRRTQPGLYTEQWRGRAYMRKRCPDGHNDKHRLEDIGKLPLTIRPDGSFLVLF